MRQLVTEQLKFLIVSAVTAIAYVGGVYVLTSAGAFSLVANFALYVIVTSLNYVASSYFTFSTKRVDWRSVVLFAMLVVAGSAANTLAMKFLVDSISTEPWIAATVFLFAWAIVSFTVQKYVVFTHKSANG